MIENWTPLYDIAVAVLTGGIPTVVVLWSARRRRTTTATHTTPARPSPAHRTAA